GIGSRSDSIRHRLWLDLYPINYIERFITASYRVDSPDVDGDAAAWRTGVLGHIHASGPALQRLFHSGVDRPLNVLGTNGNMGTGHVLLPHGAVTNHHKFIQTCQIFFQ